MKIFVIIMLSALVATVLIDGCLSQSSAVPIIRVAKKTERAFRWLGKRVKAVDKHREIIELRKRSPQEFGQLSFYENFPKVQIKGDGEYIVYPETLRGNFTKDLQDSLNYIEKRLQEMIPNNRNPNDLTKEWRYSFALSDDSIVSNSILDEGLSEITKIDEELLFAVNSHDTAARLTATADTGSLPVGKKLSEIKRHLNKIVTLLDSHPYAYLKVEFVDNQGQLQRLFLTSSSTSEDLDKIASKYFLNIRQS